MADTIDSLLSHQGGPEDFLDACKQGNIDAVMAILGTHLGSDPENLSRGLYGATLQGYTDVMEVLITKLAELKKSNGPLNRSIIVACERDQKAAIEVLIRRGADVNFRDEGGWTPLGVACFNDNVELAELILDRGASVDGSSQYRSGPIWRAIPLLAACSHMDEAMIQLLLQRGATVDIRDARSKTPLYRACERGTQNISGLLLKYCADVNAPSQDGNTPLYIACENYHQEIVVLLLEHGANIEAKNEDGGTPLHAACEAQHREIATLLLQSGADINAQNKDGETALHISCRNTDSGIARLLLESGADPKVRSRSGDTAFMVARKKGNLQLSRLLQALGADFDIESGEYGSALRRDSVPQHLKFPRDDDMNEQERSDQTTVSSREFIVSLPSDRGEQSAHTMNSKQKLRRLLKSRATSQSKSSSDYDPLSMDKQDLSRRSRQVLETIQGPWRQPGDFQEIDGVSSSTSTMSDTTNEPDLLPDFVRWEDIDLPDDIPSTFDPHFHIPNCVHLANSGIIESSTEYKYLEQEDLAMDYAASVTEEVLSCLGIAGIFSQDESIHVVRTGASAQGIVQLAEASGILECQDLVSRICNAIGLLQKRELCCNTISVPIYATDGVRMCKIKLSHLDIIQSLILQSSRSIEELDHCVRTAQCVLTDLKLGSPSIRGFPKEYLESVPIIVMLQHIMLVLQISSLAILMFAGAHLGQMDLPGEEEGIEIFRVLLPGRTTDLFKMRKMKLACLGNMLQDTLWVLDVGADEAITEPLPLLASVQDVLELWGPGELIYDASDDSAIKMVRVGGGFLYTQETITLKSGESITKAHWGLTCPLEALPGFTSDQLLLIGTVSENQHCQFTHSDQVSTYGAYLVDLETSPDFWQLRTIEAALAGGYNFQAGGTLGFHKRDAVKKKHVNVSRWPRFPAVLDEQCGLMVSACTGVAQRVALREVIAECLVEMLEPVRFWENAQEWPNDWDIAFKLEFLEALRSDAFLGWLLQQDNDHKVFVRAAIAYMLQILRSSGVTEDGKSFKVSWAQNGNPYAALKMRIKDDMAWLKIFEDGPDSATFATMTHRCYETSQQPCRAAMPLVTLQPHPLTLLATEVVCISTDQPGGRLSFVPLELNRSYWFGRRKSTIIGVAYHDSSNQMKVVKFSVSGVNLLRDLAGRKQVLRECQMLGLRLTKELVLAGPG